MRLDPGLTIVVAGAAAALLLSPVGPWPHHLSAYSLPVVIVVAAVLANTVIRRRARRHHSTTFLCRDPVHPSATFDDAYASPAMDRDTFVRHWGHCARLLRISPELLRATDRFKVELAPTSFFDGLGHPLDDLEHYALARARTSEDKVALARMNTFGELVAWLTAKERSDRSTGR